MGLNLSGDKLLDVRVSEASRTKTPAGLAAGIYVGKGAGLWHRLALRSRFSKK